MENPASQAHPNLHPEVLNLLEDHPRGFRPSRARQVVLMEEALTELERFGPLLELRLGQVLASLVRGGHKHLGYVTPAVFCREELGISATAAWDSVRLAEGLLRRSILRQAFLEEGLPRPHVLELLRLDEAGDAEWAARAAGLPVQELRRALRPLRSSKPGEEQETTRVRTWDLEAEPYATWLAAVELARRREGRDLGPADALEQILAEFAAGRPLDAPAPPPFQRDPRWQGTGADMGSGEATSATDACGTAPDRGDGESGPGGATPDVGSAEARTFGPEAGSSGAAPEANAAEAPRDLACMLRQDLPRSPRKLTRLARRLRGACVSIRTEHRRGILFTPQGAESRGLLEANETFCNTAGVQETRRGDRRGIHTGSQPRENAWNCSAAASSAWSRREGCTARQGSAPSAPGWRARGSPPARPSRPPPGTSAWRSTGSCARPSPKAACRPPRWTCS